MKLVQYYFETKENEEINAEIVIPMENRNIVSGTVKEHNGQIAKDAIVKLYEMTEHTIIKEISYALTDENGQFLFGPLKSNKKYLIKVWYERVKVKQVVVAPKKEPENPNPKKINQKVLKDKEGYTTGEFEMFELDLS